MFIGKGRFLQLGDTLEEFLVQATDDQKLRQVMMSLSEAIRTIAFKASSSSAHPCSYFHIPWRHYCPKNQPSIDISTDQS